MVIHIILTKQDMTLNVKDNKIFILSNGAQYIFGLEKIRGFSSRMGGGAIQHSNSTIIGGGIRGAAHNVGSSIGTVMASAAMKRKSFDDNGIFIEISDIDTPVLQIKFSSESELRRSSEIFNQFLDGTLIDYDEYLKNKNYNEYIKFNDNNIEPFAK